MEDKALVSSCLYRTNGNVPTTKDVLTRPTATPREGEQHYGSGTTALHLIARRCGATIALNACARLEIKARAAEHIVKVGIRAWLAKISERDPEDRFN